MALINGMTSVECKLQGLPDDCMREILSHLSLQDALNLSECSRTLRSTVRRNFGVVASVLDVSHTDISDFNLWLLVNAAKGNICALSVADCSRITFQGLLTVLERIGSNLLYLDISAFRDRIMVCRFISSLPNLRVLRLAHCFFDVTPVPILEMANHVGASFISSSSLRVLDLTSAYSLHDLNFDHLPNLTTLICPYTKYMTVELQSEFEVHARIPPGPFLSHFVHPPHPSVTVVGFEIWASIYTAKELDRHLSYLVGPVLDAMKEHEQGSSLPITTNLRASVVRSSQWSPYKHWVMTQLPKNCMYALRLPEFDREQWQMSGFPVILDDKAILTFKSRSTLLVAITQKRASDSARLLTRTCGQGGCYPLKGGERSAISTAVISRADMDDDPSLFAALTPRTALSLVHPTAVALFVLAASRKLPQTLGALLPSKSVVLGDNSCSRARFQLVLRKCLSVALITPRTNYIPSGKEADVVWEGTIPSAEPKRSWLTSCVFPDRSFTSDDMPSPSINSMKNSNPVSTVIADARKTAAIVEVLLRRGMVADEEHIYQSAQLGYFDALRQMLLSGVIGELEGPDVEIHDFQLLKARILKQYPWGRGTLLIAAAKCDTPFLALNTVALFLRLMETVENKKGVGDVISRVDVVKKRPRSKSLPNEDDMHGAIFPAAFGGDEDRSENNGCTRNYDADIDDASEFDEDAGKAMVAALERGNAEVARMIADERPRSVMLVVKNRRDAVKALLAIGRRVSRGSASDADFAELGQRIISVAARTVKLPVDEWLSREIRDGHGRTILHYAAGASNPEFALTLVGYSRLVQCRDDFGATPLCVAVESHASRGCLRALLECGHTDVDARDMAGRTALHRAADARNGAAAAVLLSFGADYMLADTHGITPAHVDSDLLYRASHYGFVRDDRNNASRRKLHQFLDGLRVSEEECLDSRTF